MSDYKSPQQLRAMFNTKAGRKAFDTLNALGSPRWVYFPREEDGRMYLSPTLEVKEGAFLTSPGAGWGTDLDSIVIEIEKAFKKEASKPGARVVANAYREDRAEFTYDKRTDTFKPYPPKR